MRKLHCLVSAAATTFAVPANAHLAGMGRKTWQEWHVIRGAARAPQRPRSQSAIWVNWSRARLTSDKRFRTL